MTTTPFAWNNARCKGAPPDIFITPGDLDDEPFYPSPAAQVYCQQCPIRTECLEWALNHDERGTWGGTSSYQRRQIKREMERVKCPSCASTELIYENKLQLCIACGMSWPII